MSKACLRTYFTGLINSKMVIQFNCLQVTDQQFGIYLSGILLSLPVAVLSPHLQQSFIIVIRLIIFIITCCEPSSSSHRPASPPTHPVPGYGSQCQPPCYWLKARSTGTHTLLHQWSSTKCLTAFTT